MQPGMFEAVKGRRPLFRTFCVVLMFCPLGLFCCAPSAQEGPSDSTGSKMMAEVLEGVSDEHKGGRTVEFKLSSKAFEPGAFIPKEYTGDGSDVSPPLKWTDAPEGTVSFALICDDPDAPVGTWVHWVIYGIPCDTRELPENVSKSETLPTGAMQGLNDFRKVGYGGPAPPRGPAHRYYFKLYALDTELSLKTRATKKDLESAMKGHVLGLTELMGRYQR